ncbi:MAG: stage III sporulation protein AB [Clostridiales bacterium]|nr:stage III sporulation protein AB [Clostridiales bacterium]
MLDNSCKNLIKTVLSVLPSGISEAFLEGGAQNAEELRLRVGRPLQIIFPFGERLIEDTSFTSEEAGELLEKLCRHSVYSRREELINGFVAFEGGARIGVCGRPVIENGAVKSMTEISGFNIRFTCEARGCAEPVMGFVSEQGRPVSALVVSPPGGGKTTLLRDMARCFSYGIGTAPVKVAIADERGELAGLSAGLPSFDIGPRTDVMDRMPKAAAMRLLVRTMSPDVMITDEIGGMEDAAAVAEASRCGTAVIASAHASTADDILMRPSLKNVVETGAFGRILLLKRTGSKLHISPLKI